MGCKITFVASWAGTVLKNMLGTLNKYYFLLRVCALSADAHPYEVIWHECIGSAMYCLPDIANKSPSED